MNKQKQTFLLGFWLVSPTILNSGWVWLFKELISNPRQLDPTYLLCISAPSLQLVFANLMPWGSITAGAPPSEAKWNWLGSWCPPRSWCPWRPLVSSIGLTSPWPPEWVMWSSKDGNVPKSLSENELSYSSEMRNIAYSCRNVYANGYRSIRIEKSGFLW